jgi:hypothetical protein
MSVLLCPTGDRAEEQGTLDGSDQGELSPAATPHRLSALQRIATYLPGQLSRCLAGRADDIPLKNEWKEGGRRVRLNRGNLEAPGPVHARMSHYGSAWALESKEVDHIQRTGIDVAWHHLKEAGIVCCGGGSIGLGRLPVVGGSRKFKNADSRYNCCSPSRYQRWPRSRPSSRDPALKTAPRR